MKKIMIIIAVVLITMIDLSTAVAQLPVGQGINPWYHESPQSNNFAFLPLNSITTVTVMGGTRMDAFHRHPNQGTVLASGPIADNIFIGGKIDRQQAGLSSHLDLQFGFNYFVFLDKEEVDKQKGDKFSFCLSGHFTEDGFAANEAQVIDLNDPGLTNISQFQPNGNASAGIAFLREDKYHFGLSAYNLLPTKNAFSNLTLTNPTQRVFYFIGSYTFLSEKKISLELSGAAAYANEKAYEWQVGMNVKYDKHLWIGAGYCSAGALKFDVGVRTDRSLSFGYMCIYGSWVDATKYTYKAFNNGVYVKLGFNNGRANKEGKR